MMTADMTELEQMALDGMPPAPPGETTTMQIAGPADAAFKTSRWALEQVREHLAAARADKKRLGEFIARLVVQEKFLARMTRIAEEFDREEEAPQLPEE